MMCLGKLGRTVAAMSAALVLQIAPLSASAAYPDRPVRIVVPFAPGGTTDVLARMIAMKLTERTGAAFVVENRAGAGGNIGMDVVAKAEPDGYTLGMIITSHAINVSLPPKPPYDVIKDFAMVSVLTLSTNVLVTAPNVPAKDLSELLALAKTGKLHLSYASPGKGTTPHLSGELLQQMSGVPMQHVPYRGAGPAMADVMAGVVPMMFDAVTTAEPQIRAGKVRAIAVTSAKRSPVLQGVPTMQEAGFKGYVVDGWLGMAAPAKMPADRLQWLREQVQDIMKTPEMAQWVEKQGMTVANYSPAQSANFLKEQVSFWSGILAKSKEANQ